jgi:hypothetical protein
MAGRFLDGGWDRAQVTPYSDRKQQRDLEDQPLPIKHVVKIQQLAARGRTVDEIVAELAHLRIPYGEVMRILTPTEQAAPRQRHRPERANVGYQRIKKSWPGYGR